MKNIPYVQQNKVPEIRALWDEAFIFRALPHIFGAKSIQPPSKKWPVRLWLVYGYFLYSVAFRWSKSFLYLKYVVYQYVKKFCRCTD